MTGIVPGLIAAAFTWLFLVAWMPFFRKHFLVSKLDGNPTFEAKLKRFTIGFASVMAALIFLIFFGISRS